MAAFERAFIKWVIADLREAQDESLSPIQEL